MPELDFSVFRARHPWRVDLSKQHHVRFTNLWAASTTALEYDKNESVVLHEPTGAVIAAKDGIKEFKSGGYKDPEWTSPIPAKK